MALWGTADSILSTGTVTVDYSNKTVTGSGTTFSNATVGSVISIGVGKTYGEAVISGITSDTLISIASTQFLSGAPIAGIAYTLSQKPVYTLQDSNYSATQIYGVDTVEVGTKYNVTHAGWVGIKTYVDAQGQLRRKSEVLVAFSGISTGVTAAADYGDANDDTVLPDVYIVINTQPVGTSVTSGGTASFSVSAATVPAGGALTYQWESSTNNEASYSNITGATSATLSTSTFSNGYFYRVVVSSAGADNVTSVGAKLTVV